MVIESVVVTMGVAAFLAYQNWSLGLTSTVPKQPEAKAHWLAAQCLESLKKEVTGATLRLIATDSLQLETPQGSVSLSSRQGKLWVARNGGGEQAFHELGPDGLVEFKQLSEKAIFAKIVAVDGPARHEVGLRLEVATPVTPS